MCLALCGRNSRVCVCGPVPLFVCLFVCVCVCARARARVCVCVYTVRIVSWDKILRLTNTLIIITFYRRPLPGL